MTGSAGLVGSEAVGFFCEAGCDVVGIDNDMRKTFFGNGASTHWNRERLGKTYKNYTHLDTDIRDEEAISRLFAKYSKEIVLVIHAAAQPSHDWAASAPLVDFAVNASGTLILLENVRRHCPEAVFIFTSTNKVYGDRPNQLPLEEGQTRFELPTEHPWYEGIDETMPIDQCLHSLFGTSKIAADVITQEYGRYFGLKTGVFRGGCLTGPAHSGTMLHGFLSYLMRCCITHTKYSVLGYRGKQVRDNIHSRDLINAFDHFFLAPRCGEVYNIGGGRHCNTSVLEAIGLCEEVSGKKLKWEYVEESRVGDHIWWISGMGKFREHYPDWTPKHTLMDILIEIHDLQKGVCRADTTTDHSSAVGVAPTNRATVP